MKLQQISPDEKETDGSGLVPFLAISMTGEQLVRLYQNPFYLQAYEFFLTESNRLSEILEKMQCSPCCHGQLVAVRLQSQKMNQARLVLQQLREIVLSRQESSSPSLANEAS